MYNAKFRNSGFHSHYKILVFPSHYTGIRTQDLMISSKRLWTLEHRLVRESNTVSLTWSLIFRIDRWAYIAWRSNVMSIRDSKAAALFTWAMIGSSSISSYSCSSSEIAVSQINHPAAFVRAPEVVFTDYRWNTTVNIDLWCNVVQGLWLGLK
jgi:hypothetical protein